MNDCVKHSRWPKGLIRENYPIDRGFNADPNFRWDNANRFKLPKGENHCRGRGVVVSVALPDGSIWQPDKAFNIGWHQDEPDDPPDPEYFFGPRYQQMR